MNRAEIAELLTVIATLDRRTLGESDVIAWHGTLGDLRAQECKDAAVRHYAESTDWLMPAHIRRRVLASRQDSAMRQAIEGRDDLVPMPEWFHTTVAEHKSRTREANLQRKERGDAPRYGETVYVARDRQPR